MLCPRNYFLSLFKSISKASSFAIWVWGIYTRTDISQHKTWRKFPLILNMTTFRKVPTSALCRIQLCLSLELEIKPVTGEEVKLNCCKLPLQSCWKIQAGLAKCGCSKEFLLQGKEEGVDLICTLMFGLHLHIKRDDGKLHCRCIVGLWINYKETTRDVGVIQTHRRTRKNREVKLMSWSMSHNHLEASI